jgi:pimeloyl-ACP methyl ester carboxylesterase
MTGPDAGEVVVHAGREHDRDVPFVSVPGIGMSHRYSARMHDALARTATVLSLDLPGFGGSPKPAERMSVPDYALAIARALDERRIGRAVLIGHSMGASAAAVVTADYLRTGPRWLLTELRAMLAYRTEEAIGGAGHVLQHTATEQVTRAIMSFAARDVQRSPR